MRLEPPDARSRRCQHLPTPGGRTCALKAAGAARTLCGLYALRLPSWRRCLHAPPTERRRPAQEATPCAGQRSSCQCALRAGRSPSHRVASCAALRQRRTSRLAAAVPEPSCAWGRTSAWAALRWLRLPRRCVGPLGRALLLARPGACLACPSSCGDGSNPSPRPRRASSSTPPRQGQALRVAAVQPGNAARLAIHHAAEELPLLVLAGRLLLVPATTIVPARVNFGLPVQPEPNQSDEHNHHYCNDFPPHLRAPQSPSVLDGSQVSLTSIIPFS